jgi:hypothetical protein
VKPLRPKTSRTCEASLELAHGDYGARQVLSGESVAELIADLSA